jgi:hypothetical protein
MFVQPEDLLILAGLGGRPFEELLFDLVVAEASRHGIPLAAVRWDPRTNIGDGGRDIIVDAEHSDANPRFVPQRRSIWSAKSGEDGTRPATLREELTTPRQGQTHGHEGFLLNSDEVAAMLKQSPKNAEVLFPYLTGDELLHRAGPAPFRWVIDFHPRDIFAARAYREPFARVERHVLPTRQRSAEEEERRNATVLHASPKAKVNHHHRNFLARWWLLSYPRQDLIAKISTLSRYIGCARVTKRPIFEFIHSSIRPSDVVQVFSFPDDYSFGILQSGLHWPWFVARCSTLKGDFRYTSDTVFDTFPWPQAPTLLQVEAVAAAALDLRTLRRKVMADNGWSLRDLYRTLELPGKNPLRDAQQQLDIAVRAAYGMNAKEDPLAFLLSLNKAVAGREAQGQPVTAPGLPPCVTDPAPFVTTDCVPPA